FSTVNAVEFQSVSKSYAIYDSPGDRLKELLSLNRVRCHKDFLALDDVTFEVKRGETFCIVGENGSGKSTALRSSPAFSNPAAAPPSSTAASPPCSSSAPDSTPNSAAATTSTSTVPSSDSPPARSTSATRTSKTSPKSATSST